jgi:hypothetical protein
VLNDLIDAGTGALHLDPTITPADLIDIGQRFKDFNPDNLDTYSVPAASTTKFGAAVLIVNAQQAEPIFDVFRGVDANSPDSVLVAVQNGTSTSGIASQVADDLRKLGFSIPAEYTGDADRFDYQQTVIRYLPGNEAKAQRLASYLGVVPAFEQVGFLINADVSLVVGADWKGVVSTPSSTVAIPETTTTAPPVTAKGRTTTTTSTTTTVSTAETAPSQGTTTTVGVVPQTPEDVHC